MSRVSQQGDRICLEAVNGFQRHECGIESGSNGEGSAEVGRRMTMVMAGVGAMIVMRRFIVRLEIVVMRLGRLRRHGVGPGTAMGHGRSGVLEFDGVRKPPRLSVLPLSRPAQRTITKELPDDQRCSNSHWKNPKCDLWQSVPRWQVLAIVDIECSKQQHIGGAH